MGRPTMRFAPVKLTEEHGALTLVIRHRISAYGAEQGMDMPSVRPFRRLPDDGGSRPGR
jgi:hypothetical protein